MSNAQAVTGSEQASFNRVAALNEAAKQLIARSHVVNLLALDARVQSKREGSSLRGFDEVSSQMQHWSRDLHSALERLAALSREVVVEVSTVSKEGHLLALLRRAANSSTSPLADETRFRLEALHHGRECTLLGLWRKVDETLGDLDLLGMMAVVLSRSAMIEASSGTAEQRAQLGHVAQEFYCNSEAVVTVLKAILNQMKRA